MAKKQKTGDRGSKAESRAPSGRPSLTRLLLFPELEDRLSSREDTDAMSPSFLPAAAMSMAMGFLGARAANYLMGQEGQDREGNEEVDPVSPVELMRKLSRGENVTRKEQQLVWGALADLYELALRSGEVVMLQDHAPGWKIVREERGDGKE